MNESKKLLIGFVVVGGLCLCIAAAAWLTIRELGERTEKMVNGDPTSVAQIKKDMVDFDIPPGYEERAMNVFVYDIIILDPDISSNSGSMIMLMQYKSLIPANPSQIEQQMRQSAQQQGVAGAQMHFVETLEKEIRGETVEITVSEGDYEGFTMRQWMAVFEGKNGPTILMVQGPVDEWNDELLDDFVESIK
jgi:hypothetical protein